MTHNKDFHSQNPILSDPITHLIMQETRVAKCDLQDADAVTTRSSGDRPGIGE